MPEGAQTAGLDDVLVVGTGQASFQLAASLREKGFAGRIRLIGDETGLPYQRPPLSKAYLTGKSDRAALDLRSPGFFQQFDIQIADERRAVKIDRDRKTVHFASNEVLPYGHLVLATGARNRTLPIPGAGLDGVLQLRSVGDADALRQRLAGLKKLVIIGAGFIGLEVAALAAAIGAEVTVLELSSRPMSRALSRPMSDFFKAAHEKTGVRFGFDAAVTRINGSDGRAISVEAANGEIFPADLVLVGVGVVANDELAAQAGLPVDNGIAVDEHLLTIDPAISAIGDCAVYPQHFAGGAPTRLESVQNAVDHGRCVAARLTGKPHPYRAVPWFWSDQGPLKLQIAGIPAPHDHCVVRGDPSSGAFSVFCFRDGRLAGVESVNKPAHHMVARRLLGSAVALTPAEAGDTSFDLKARAGTATVAA
ncbi:MAG: FAD-dependent pyridine nucleotide-disulfide oxidoreductase [Tardiphaga sp.]|jgi:3-phenylpropionate/trans-cinnamate dioxygenase ferredoxin reductase subunit|nr:FAD-dependent pyridine nucleotide-disulfide oxidoreductase [Tardiphaga sp.]